MKRKDFVELLIVILLSIVDTLFILRNTLLSPQGLIYIRDYHPLIIQHGPQFIQDGQINIVLLMSNPDMLIFLLEYFLTSETLSKLYFALPIALAFISMYFSVRYLTNNKILSSIAAFLYTITPTFMYFNYWYEYATFVAFYPLLLVGLDYISKKDAVKSAILLAFVMSLTTTDPRGFLFTFITVIGFLIYQILRFKSSSIKFIKMFLLSLPLYVLLNIRTFYALLVNHVQYTSTSLGITFSQLWLNYYTVSFADNLRGLGLFWPWVNFYQLPYSYQLSLFLPAFTILGFIYFYKNLWRSVNTFYISFYIFLVILISSYITAFGNKIQLNLIYYINDFLLTTPLYKYLWLIMPTFVSEMIIAPLFLTFASVANELLKNANISLTIPQSSILSSLKGSVFSISSFSKLKLNPSQQFRKLYSILLLAVIIFAQIVFSYSSFATGNYGGQYVTVEVPKPVYDVAKFLQNVTGKIAVYATPVDEKHFYAGKYYPTPLLQWGLPNTISLPLVENFTNLLQYYGVEYVVANQNITFFLHQPGLKEVYNADGIVVFKNEYFKPTYTAKGVYLLAGSPNQVPYNVAAVPFYVYVPPEYLAGVIGQSQEEAQILIKADIFYNYSVDIPNAIKFIPATKTVLYTNFTLTSVSFSQPISGSISAVAASYKAEESIKVKPGNYAVILRYLEYPGGGVIEISNGTYSLSVDTNGANVTLETIFLGYMSVSGNEIKLIHPDNNGIYIVNLELIPETLYNQHTTLNPHNVTVTIYPVEGDVIQSVGYNIIVGNYRVINYPMLLPILVLNFMAFVILLVIYFGIIDKSYLSKIFRFKA